MAERVTRLYEQGASERRIGDYVRRWVGWVNGGWVEPRPRKTTVGAAGTGGSGRDGGERIGELGWRKCPIKGRATRTVGISAGGPTGWKSLGENGNGVGGANGRWIMCRKTLWCDGSASPAYIDAR